MNIDYLCRNPQFISIVAPWLASLYVAPAHRKNGIAGRLIDEAVHLAGSLGFPEMYLRTEHTSDYYRARGWTSRGYAVDEIGRHTEIFSKPTVRL